MVKPIYDTFQIEHAITTTWDEVGDDPRSWDDHDISFFLGTYNTIIEGDHDEEDGFVPMSNKLQAFVTEAFAEWGEIANLTFTQVTGDPDDADITFAYSMSTNGNGTYASPTLNLLDDTEIEHEAIWFSADPAAFSDQQDATISFVNYGFITMLHEIGHALGLSHPGPYDASQDTPLSYEDSAVFAQDNRQYTIMSYFGYETGKGWTQDGTPPGDLTPGSLIIYPSTPMVYDILAIQDKYGADMTTRAGDTTYGFHSTAGWAYYDFSITPKVVFTIWDGGGNDTLDASFTGNFTQRIDLNPSAYSDVGGLIDNIAIAFGVTIENAIGGDGKDTITGNSADNHLSGGDGDDQLFGGDGNDVLDGGTGKDILHGSLGYDTLSGGDDDDFLFGDAAGDVLDGGKGDDHIDGGGALDGGGNASVPDTLTGGAGADTFVYSTHYRTTVITDYNPSEDTLDFTNLKWAHSFVDVIEHATQQGSDVLINFADDPSVGGVSDTLRLENFTIAQLDPALMKFSEETENPVPAWFTSVTNPYNPNYTFTERTAPLADGGFAIVQSSSVDAAANTIIAHRFNDIGIETGTFTVAATNSGAAFDVVGLPNGNFAVVWEDYFGQSSDPNTPPPVIRARFFDSDATPLGPAFQVNTTPAIFDAASLGYNFNLTFAGASTSGELIVEWYADVDPTQATGIADDVVYRQVLSDTGGFAGGEQAFPATGFFDEQQQINYYDPYRSRVVHDPIAGTNTPVDGQYVHLSNGDYLRLWKLPIEGSNYNYTLWAEIVGKTEPVELSAGTGFIPRFSLDSGLYAGATVDELADGRIEITWTNGGFTGYNYRAPGFDTVIFDDHTLTGFTKPGTDGDDVMRGGPGADRLYGLGGDDTFIPGLGADVLDGGDGTDTVDYSRSLSGVDIDLTRAGSQNGGHAEGDILVSIENVIGSSYHDNLTGDAGANEIYGGYGDDYIIGGGGADQLHGQAGDDHVTLQGDNGTAWGEAGDDTLTATGDSNWLYGGDGDDTLHIISGDNNNLIGGVGDDDFFVEAGSNNYLEGEDGDDELHLGGSGTNNALSGGDGDDDLYLTGSGANNILFGGDGRDYLSAVAHTGPGVVFYGGLGNDTLIGSHGDDSLEGGGGDDHLFGGDGIDTAYYSSYVTDYEVSFDSTLGVFTVADLRAGSPDGTDIVADDVEYLSFGGWRIEAGYFRTKAKVADGYISGATVFADANHNGVQDASEAFATTDIGGGFTLPTGAAGPLVVTGGTDVGTGLAFGGRLLAPAGYNYITPLTTLVELATENGVANPQQTILSNLGIDPASDIANQDPILQDLLIGNSQPEMTGICIANTVDLIASAIEGAHPGEFGSAYDAAFKALASSVGAGAFDFSSLPAITAVINATLSLDGTSLDASVVGGLASVIVAFNSTTAQTSGFVFDAVAKVAQGDAAAAIKLAAADPSKLSDAVDHFTGQALDDAVTAEVYRAGDAAGPFLNYSGRVLPDSYTVATDHTLTVDAASGVLANDLDPDGDTLTAVPITQSTQHGTVTINADGSFSYTPDTNYVGPDDFSYEASDGVESSWGYVAIQVDGPHPVVTNVTAEFKPGDGDVADSYVLTLTMSRPVTVDTSGFPFLLYTNIGEATYQVSLSGPDKLVFMVAVGDDAPTGVPLQITGDDIGDYLAHVVDSANGAPANLFGAYVTFPDLIIGEAGAISLALATDSGLAGDGVTNVGTVNVSGLEAGTSWEYAVNGGAFVAGSGNSFTLTGDGPKSVLVHQTDAAGNVSADASLSFTLDTAAAVPPSVALATDSGVAGDGVTNVGTVNVSSLEAGASWEYAVNGGAFVAGSGTSFTLTGDGAKSVLVHQTDAAGNVSADASLAFTLDTTVAAPPPVALATDSGVVGDGVTNVGTVNVSSLEAGASWEYAVNGGAFVAGSGNSFMLTGDGPKSVLVHQTDAAGNVSGDASLAFTLDTVTSDTITTSGGSVTSAAQTVQGTGEVGAKVQLLDGSNPLGTEVVVDSTGHWSAAVTLVGNGNHVITAAATDIAGNNASSNAITLTLGNSDVISQPGQTVVHGTGGSDHIVVQAGNLLVAAGSGDDVLSLSPQTSLGIHLLDGGAGTDTLDVSGTTIGVSVNLSSGYATGSQVGLSVFSSIENVIGGSGNDTITGNSAANRLDGGGGRDIIRAGGGNDTIIGGAGNDTLTGGSGNDSFVFRPNFGKDVITDFQVGSARAASAHDVLDLHGLGFTSIQDVLDHTDPGSNAVIHAGLDDITLLGVTKGQLTTHQFDLLI